MPGDKQTQEAGSRSTLEQAGRDITKMVTVNMGLSYADVREIIHQERERILQDLWNKAQQMLRDAGITPGSVPLTTLIPLLRHASLEQDEYLHEHWTALLANAANPDRKVTPSLADILRQLTPADASIAC